MLKKILAVKQRHKQVKINTPKVKKQMCLKGEMILKTFSILQVLAFEKISFVCLI